MTTASEWLSASLASTLLPGQSRITEPGAGRPKAFHAIRLASQRVTILLLPRRQPLCSRFREDTCRWAGRSAVRSPAIGGLLGKTKRFGMVLQDDDGHDAPVGVQHVRAVWPVPEMRHAAASQGHSCPQSWHVRHKTKSFLKWSATLAGSSEPCRPACSLRLAWWICASSAGPATACCEEPKYTTSVEAMLIIAAAAARAGSIQQQHVPRLNRNALTAPAVLALKHAKQRACGF